VFQGKTVYRPNKDKIKEAIKHKRSDGNKLERCQNFCRTNLSKKVKENQSAN